MRYNLGADALGARYYQCLLGLAPTTVFIVFYMMFENPHQHCKSKDSWHYSIPSLQHAGSRLLYNKSCFSLILFSGHILNATDPVTMCTLSLQSLGIRDDNSKSLIRPVYSISSEQLYFRVHGSYYAIPRKATSCCGV